MKQLDSTVAEITERITERSTVTRAAYLDRIKALTSAPSGRAAMGCTNLAHAFAASPANDKLVLHAERAPNLAIVTAYNDMLSAPWHGIIAFQSRCYCHVVSNRPIA